VHPDATTVEGAGGRDWGIDTSNVRGAHELHPILCRLRDSLAAHLRVHSTTQELTVRAALSGDRQIALEAFLLDPLLEQRADSVYGVRGFAGQTAFSFWFVMGNKAVTLATNVLFDSYISDMETGYKVLRSELWKRLNLQGTRFDIEPDITARILRLGYRIHEVPIRYHARSREEGKKLTWRDGVHAMTTLARLRVSSDERLFGKGWDRQYHQERHRELSQAHPLICLEGD